VARFADESSVDRGARVFTMAVTMAGSGASGADATWSASAGTVRAAGTAVNGARGRGMPSIVVTPTPAAGARSGVLMSTGGSVLGIQDSSVADTSGDVFLPADLVVGVSIDLAMDGSVNHGWLGINGANAKASSPVASGALVDAVDPAGPSATALKPGDVIVAVDDTPVRSMADLRSRLYMVPAGWPIWLRVWRNDTLTTVEVDLGSSP
jgi:S1-C subfamily serine protease